MHATDRRSSASVWPSLLFLELAPGCDLAFDATEASPKYLGREVLAAVFARLLEFHCSSDSL